MAKNSKFNHDQDVRVTPLRHHSRGGDVRRNTGNFTRGSQLIGHRLFMWKSGALIPVYIWLTVFVIALWIDYSSTLGPNDLQLIIMRIGSWLNAVVGSSELRIINLTVGDGNIRSVPIGSVPYVPEVAHAWAKAMRGLIGSLVFSLAIAVPLSVLFIRFANWEGKGAMDEHHERGSRLVTSERLTAQVDGYNRDKFVEQAEKLFPEITPQDVLKLSYSERKAAGIHHPYKIAGIDYPHQLEASHTMLVGTTGTGKSTAFKDIIRQIRQRGHNAIVFDVTGGYVENFYDPERDIILNPNDERCPNWTLFNECNSFADFHSASLALIPSDEGGGDPFWGESARSLFIEMAVRLKERGLTTNKDLVDQLMKATLKAINRMLVGTIAQPMTEEQVSKTALSIRMVFNAHATIFRFLKDGPNPFSIKEWITGPRREGGLLFINSSYNDLSMTRAIITLWMDIAINAMMTLPKTRQVNTWFLFDELGALHKLPAIENGLQTARQFGGAFMLGVHSFSALEQIYGKEGARNIISLARSKLFLATSDHATAEEAAKLIGQREVRKVEETVSYGYDTTRDASTLTSDRRIENLILASDITELPALHGVIKFPEGFPAAQVVLKLRHYPVVAKDVIRRNNEIVPIALADSLADDEDVDEDGVVVVAGGRETDAPAEPLLLTAPEPIAPVERAAVNPSDVTALFTNLAQQSALVQQPKGDTPLNLNAKTGATAQGGQGASPPVKDAPPVSQQLYDALAARPLGADTQPVQQPSQKPNQAVAEHFIDFGEPDKVVERDDHERR